MNCTGIVYVSVPTESFYDNVARTEIFDSMKVEELQISTERGDPIVGQIQTGQLVVWS
jgi:hypothetical protein